MTNSLVHHLELNTQSDNILCTRKSILRECATHTVEVQTSHGFDVTAVAIIGREYDYYTSATKPQNHKAM